MIKKELELEDDMFFTAFYEGNKIRGCSKRRL